MNPSFKIKPRNSELYFNVYVHEDLKTLRREANKFDEENGQPPENDDIYGVCHPYERIKIVDDEEVRLNNVGILRFSREHLSSEIVAHETLHAAFWIYRLEYATDHNANFKDTCNQDEENFVHLYGQLFRSINGKLHKHGFWV